MSMKRQSVLILICVSAVLTLFHNCGQFANTDTINASCATDMLPTFKNTFYIFFQDNTCTRCHSASGLEGIPHFAAADAALGLSFFQKIGPAKVKSKLEAGHNGYNYSALATTLSDYQAKWNKASEGAGSCTDANGVPELAKSLDFFEDTLEFGRYPVKADMLTWQTVQWSLDNGKRAVLAGTSVSLDIKVQADDFRTPEAYIVGNLKFLSPTKRLRIKGVTVLLNDQTYSVSTYQGINVIVEPGSDYQVLIPGSAAGVFVLNSGEVYQNSDSWKIRFDSIEEEL
jgi:hypothetical protein